MENSNQDSLQPSEEEYELETQKLKTRFKRAIASAIILAIVAIIINFYSFIELASIISISASLLGLYAFMVWLQYDLKGNIKVEKISKKDFGIAALLLLGIFGIFLLFLMIVSQIDWFYYYIVNSGGEPYNIFGFIIPQLHLRLIITVISGLVFFLITMLFDFRSINKGLKQAYKQKKTPLEIFFIKDEFVTKYSSRIVYKSTGFVTAIGLAMIPYTIEGFTIIIPFMLALLGPFILILVIVRYFYQNSLRKASEKEFMLEETKICTNCKKRAFLSAKFCGECGESFKMQYEIYENMKFCKECKGINPESYSFCRYCGNDISSIEETGLKKQFKDFFQSLDGSSVNASKKSSPPKPENSKPVEKPTKNQPSITQEQKEIGLADVPGLGATKAELLNAIGITTIEDLINCDPKEVAAKISGVGVKGLIKWIQSAKELFSTRNS